MPTTRTIHQVALLSFASQRMMRYTYSVIGWVGHVRMISVAVLRGEPK